MKTEREMFRNGLKSFLERAKERAALTEQSIIYASGTVLLVVLLLVFGLRMTVILPVRTIGAAATAAAAASGGAAF